MSCDFSILAYDPSLTSEEAGRRHGLICDDEVADLPAAAAIEDLYLELTAQHPEIDDVPEDSIDDTDLCPWSIAMERSPGHLLVSCVWSKAEYVEALLLELTQKHNLALYDPQTDSLSQPMNGAARPTDTSERTGKKPWWRFW